MISGSLLTICVQNRANHHRPIMSIHTRIIHAIFFHHPKRGNENPEKRFLLNDQLDERRIFFERYTGEYPTILC
ncbi:hypothetical protein KA405_01855 [Patescibacteria group bacterium]|nr:hypothetical protein [Patescibacteria group bacterium]